MTPGSRWNGTLKISAAPATAGRHAAPRAEQASRRPSLDGTRHKGRHIAAKDPILGQKAARKRAGKAVPAAVIAATLAAGAAAYLTMGSGSGAPSEMTAAMAKAPTAGLTIHGASTSATGHALASVASRAAAKQGGAASSTAKSARPASPTALTCDLNYYLLPANVTAIVRFLLAHGYSDNAAAGIAGNMYQESKGDPEAVGMGGGGLIGFTPLPAGYVTGNPTADLQMQLQAVLTYNQQWASYLPALNSAASPADAAYIYVTYFERAGIPAASTREASADDVASACGI